MSIWRVIGGKYTQTKVLFWTVYPCEAVCVRGGLSGLHIGGKTLGGLGLQGQPGVSSVRNIFEG